MNQKSKAALLRRLHHGPEILLLPNAWDAGSACVIAAEGFPAIATTSSGCAAVLGYPDGQHIPRSEMIFLLAKIARAVDVPVTADMEAGYDDAVETALDVIAAGAAGLNLEDRARGELLPLQEQVERLRAVRRAADSSGVPLVINARTDIFLAQHGDPDTRFDRSVERLNAYRDAGADCLFAPGVRDRDTIARLVKAVNGPLNILAAVGSPSVLEMKQLGVARVSLGGGPSRVALGAVRQFARELRDHGTLAALADQAIPPAEAQKLFSRA
jgi:2-methylisocitrate lyase-like PEP mutase family enzyme